MAQDPNKSLQTKVVILGDTGVGKTSMVNRYVRGQFTGSTTATIGAAFTRKNVNVADWTVALQIWDTAGQERFRSMAPMYYRGAHAAILVFDATNPETLETVDGWVTELQNHTRATNEDIVMVLASNKSDLASMSETSVSLKDAQAYSKEIGAQLFETSAKTGKGVNEMFFHVAKVLAERETQARKNGTSRRREDSTVDFGDDDPSENDENKKCC